MTFVSKENPEFRSKFALDVFNAKYKHADEGCGNWPDLCHVLVEQCCDGLMTEDEKFELKRLMREMKFVPAGRFLYYSGRPVRAYQNCFLYRSESDDRESWSDTMWKIQSSLMVGGGCGNVYSVYRPSGSHLHRTGGVASGPIPLMIAVNEMARQIQQGGSRRSALWAGLHHWHGDIDKFLKCKNWYAMKVAGTDKTIAQLKEADFNYPAPLDGTNISVLYDNRWLDHYNATGDYGPVFEENVRQALRTSEPGMANNFNSQENEVCRNACTEVVSEDDSDSCTLGSINMGRIDSFSEFKTAVELGTKFLICGTIRGDAPFQKVADVRNANRRIGTGLMGMHEWLLKRGMRYEVTPEMHEWLAAYRDVTDRTAKEYTERLGVSPCKGKRAIAPTGTIGILASTTTGIEPLYSVAYKRRFLRNGTQWVWQTVVDGAAQQMIDLYGVDPDSIESAIDLAQDYERRIRFQSDVQDYVDMSISSTINIPAYGTPLNNEDTVKPFAATLAKYMHRLRGFTVYADGSRGGQPLTPIPYSEAVKTLGQEFEEHVMEHDICSISGKGGTCGV